MRASALIACGLLAWLACAAITPAQAQDKVPAATRALVQQMLKTVDNTPTYSLQTTDTVRIDGELRTQETITAKQQRSPLCIYAHWSGKLHPGQEALYCQGRYNNKVKAHKGGFLGLITLSLDPTGSMAMSGELHPITDFNLYHIADQVRSDFEAAQKGQGVTFSAPQQKDVAGQPSQCVDVDHADKGRNTICISVAQHVPTELIVRNAAGQVMEHYTFSKFDPNADIDSHTFDEDNENYNF